MPRPALCACVGAVLLAHAALAWICTTLPGPRAARAIVPRMPLFILEAPPTAAPVVALAARALAAGRAGPSSPPPRPASSPQRSAASDAAPAPAGPPPDDAPPGAQASPPGPDAAFERRFLPPSRLDRPALPRSAPDVGQLQGLAWSGRPLRLRLFVDAAGVVVDVRALQSGEDPEVVARVRRMFMATGFVPARAGAADVASWRDIELDLADVAG